jgi:hypothetical protein
MDLVPDIIKYLTIINYLITCKHSKTRMEQFNNKNKFIRGKQMKKSISARIKGELREKINKEAEEKNCSVSELIRQKIIFAYEQEEKEKTIIDLKKIEGDIKFLINLLIMNSSFIAEDIRQEKGVDSWVEIFNNAKEILDNYKKTGRLAI